MFEMMIYMGVKATSKNFVCTKSHKKIPFYYKANVKPKL